MMFNQEMIAAISFVSTILGEQFCAADPETGRVCWNTWVEYPQLEPFSVVLTQPPEGGTVIVRVDIGPIFDGSEIEAKLYSIVGWALYHHYVVDIHSAMIHSPQENDDDEPEGGQ